MAVLIVFWQQMTKDDQLMGITSSTFGVEP